jgi:predicted dehydrogenase
MLKIAVVGCGLISRKKHLPAFLKLGQKAKVVALCDLNKETAKELAKVFKVKKVYTDFSKMLQEMKPDIVDISTQPATHAKLCLEALEKDCHVLSEKPFVLNAADCDAIIDAARKNNRKVCVIHNQIFNPAFIKAKDLISKGKLGKFLGMRIFLSTPLDYMSAKEAHWVHKLPGGVLAETGPHVVYMSLSFLNNIKKVYIHTKKHIRKFPWSRFEDCRIDLLADNGVSSITLLYGTNQWAAEVEIFTSRSILKIDLQNHLLLKYNRPGLALLSVAGSTFSLIYQTAQGIISNGLRYISGNYPDAHFTVISKFVESILNDTPSPVTLQEAGEVVRVMEMLFKNLKERPE